VIARRVAPCSEDCIISFKGFCLAGRERVMEFSFTAISVNGVPIHLLAEGWSYTNACCDDVLATIQRPDYILRGPGRTQIAARTMTGGRYLQVRYRELSRGQGFVISASITSSLNELAIIWRARSL
jgi:hypothetical protein